LIGLYDLLFTKSVGHFKQVALSNDEFVLLMAIIFSQPSKAKENFLIDFKHKIRTPYIKFFI